MKPYPEYFHLILFHVRSFAVHVYPISPFILYGREKKESIFRDISTGRSSISNKNSSRLSIDVHTPFQTHFIKELFIYLSTLVFLTIPQFFLIDNRSIKKIPPYNLDINYFSFLFLPFAKRKKVRVTTTTTSFSRGKFTRLRNLSIIRIKRNIAKQFRIINETLFEEKRLLVSRDFSVNFFFLFLFFAKLFSRQVWY